MTNKLRIIPLGGLGEVGKNMTLFEYGENSLLVDAGLMFPENDMFGVDYLIPDFNYLITRKETLLGIVITHVSKSELRSELPVKKSLMAPNGFLHAGSVVTLAVISNVGAVGFTVAFRRAPSR